MAQFLGEEEFSLDDEVLGEVATIEVVEEQWIMNFDSSSIANLGGVRMVLYHNGEETVALSFKLEFSCLNNIAEYKAYLTGLATALEIGIKHLKLVGDSNLVVYQAKGSFSLKELNLAQRMEKKFCTFEIEHIQRSENRYANVLAHWSHK